MASQQLRRYFIGFSTQDSASTGIRSLYDIALINQDLMAAFQTRVGERVLRPDYGCKLWNYVMEPLTAMLRDQIIQEAVRIVALDQRLVFDNIQVFELDNGFRIEIVVEYQPWRVTDTFSVTFEQSDTAYFGTSNLIG